MDLWKWVERETGRLCVFSKNLWEAKMKTLDICKGDRASAFLLSCSTQFIIRRKGRVSGRMTL